MIGHSRFVLDVVLSFDDQFAFFGFWEGESRLGDLQTGFDGRRFVGHSMDVLSVAFVDFRQIGFASDLWMVFGQIALDGFSSSTVGVLGLFGSCVARSSFHPDIFVSPPSMRKTKIVGLAPDLSCLTLCRAGVRFE